MTRPCQHHRILSSPHDDVVYGRCKHCQLERIYLARLDDTDRSAMTTAT